MKIKSLALSFFTFVTMTLAASAQKTIVDVAVGSADHTTLVAAVKAADLVATLQSAGPFTVFDRQMQRSQNFQLEQLKPF